MFRAKCLRLPCRLGILDAMTPNKIGRYEIKSELGRGGMATVYLAYDPMFEREVAIKVLPRELLHDPQFRSRFEREAKVVARLEHAAIVPVYDVGAHDDQPYFVMRLMSGGSLSDRMGTKEKLSLDETLHIIQRIAAAMDYAHSKGIIHRDMKPGNILFDEAGDPYISDFGIAKFTQSDTNLTGSGIIGTPAYMSPEQAQGNVIDARSDLYSLAVILYEMLSGKPPYDSSTPLGMVFKHVSEPIPHILDVNPRLPQGIEPVIEKALAKKREDRFDSAMNLTAALATAARGEVPDLNRTALHATRLHSQSHSSPKIASWVYAVFAILLLGSLLLFFLRPPAAVPSVPTPTQPTDTATSLPSPSPLPPTLTPMPVVVAPSPTPVEVMAFLKSNNVWLMGVDGSELTQLTNDGKPKINLQWLADGKTLVFIDVEKKCARSVDAQSGEMLNIFCPDYLTTEFFDAFQLSPDDKQVVIGLNREMFIVPFAPEALLQAQERADLLALNGCLSSAKLAFKRAWWSEDGKKLAVLFLAPLNNNRVAETIRVLDISRCSAAEPLRLDEFPGQRFVMDGYKDNLLLPSFDWFQAEKVLLTTFKRNDGYGELYYYNLKTAQAQKINPIEGACCYRDARWSSDGTHLLFFFQDIRLGAQSETQLYYIPFEGLPGEQASYTPISLPFQFFGTRDKPEPVLRPSVP